MRSISRWLAPPCSRVRIVTRKCGFKTFNSPLPLAKRGQRNVRRKWTLDVDRRRAVQLRGGGVSGGHEWRSLGGRRGGSTLIASQLPVDTWHAYLGEPTLADAILDRLVHQSHRIELKVPGESMRKVRTAVDAGASPRPEGR